MIGILSMTTTSKPKLTDEQLVKLVQKGDNHAFEQLIRRYEDKIFSLAYRILQNKEDAYDILQETAISVYKNLDKFKFKSSFSTWIYKIALNFALMQKRKQKSLLKKAQMVDVENDDNIPQTLDIENLKEIVDWSENPYISLENKEIRDILTKTLEKLPDKYKTVFILKELEGRSIEEVAKILGLSTAAAKTRLHRSRMYLRELLDKYAIHGYM